MRQLFWILLSFCLLAACSDTEQFRVNGTIAGKPNLNLRVAYWADGAFHQQITAARNGEFEFFASASQPAMVEIFDYEYRPLARLYAANGETFTVEVDRDKPFSAVVEGNDVSERWSAFTRDNADVLAAGGEGADSIVAQYVAAHPDDVVSTLLLVTLYDASRRPLHADSLLGLIDPKARPSALTDGFNLLLRRTLGADTLAELRYADRRDSAATFRAADGRLSLIVFDRAGDFRRDSVIPALERLAKRHKNLRLLEIDLEPYGSALKAYGSDTLAWRVGRVPGGLGADALQRAGVHSDPTFLLVDTAGHALYRGPNLRPALDSISTILRH